MKENKTENVGILPTSYGVRKSDSKTVFINEDNVLVFNNVELINALDPVAKSALKSLCAVGVAKIPEGVNL